MSPRAARALAAAFAALALAACQTLPPTPPWTPLAADAPAVRERLAALRAHALARRSLRANARVSLAGAAGDSFSRQLVLAEREAKLRIEVIGLLGQRALVLASDGTSYDLYRAETGRTESGPVDAGVLWRVARIPLLPSEAVGLLLAAPAIPAAAPRAESGPAGELRLAWPDRSVTLDASGTLVEARVLAAPSGEELAVAAFGDWRGAGAAAFPYRVALSFPLQKGSALIEFRDAEVNAPVDAKWFRLPSAQARVSSRPGEARP
jgi:hypothetical protein